MNGRIGICSVASTQCIISLNLSIELTTLTFCIASRCFRTGVVVRAEDLSLVRNGRTVFVDE